jgi:hypothetical protein
VKTNDLPPTRPKDVAAALASDPQLFKILVVPTKGLVS